MICHFLQHLGNLSYFLNTTLKRGSCGKWLPVTGLLCTVEPSVHCTKTYSQGSKWTPNPICVMLTKLCALALHCLSLKEKDLWLLQNGTSQLAKFVPTSLPLGKVGTFSNSHKATLSACCTLLRTISLAPFISYFYSTTQEVPCGSGDTNKGFLYRAEHKYLNMYPLH